ncbi:MAG: hypothetical protein PHQ27_11095, partial [Victivallales bacterium]|nr:hypothetical protein [Victivallales bacterium]
MMMKKVMAGLIILGCSVASVMAAKLDIVEGRYGYGKKSVDVTARVKTVKVGPNCFGILASNILTNGVDPAPDKPKVLVLKYKDGDKEKTLVIKEKTFGYVLIGAEPSWDFKLLCAFYGGQDQWRDATPIADNL